MADRNPWLRGSLEENPYDWVAFRVLRTAPSVRTGQALRQRSVEMRNLLRACPEEVCIAGTQVTEARLQQAVELLSDRSERFAEELLAHAEESYRTPMLARVAERVREACHEGDGLQPGYIEMVRAWLQQHAGPAPEPVEDERLGRISHLNPDPFGERVADHG